MAERLTDEEIHDIGKRAGIFLGMLIAAPTVAMVCTRELALLLAEVRERRAQDGAARLVCEGYTATHRERDVLRTRVAELEAALRENVVVHDGWHLDDCRPRAASSALSVTVQDAFGSGCDDAETHEDEGPDPWCSCGGRAVRDRARAALAKGGA